MVCDVGLGGDTELTGAGKVDTTWHFHANAPGTMCVELRVLCALHRAPHVLQHVYHRAQG